MNADQEQLLKQIEEEKRHTRPNRKALLYLVRQLTRYDDRESDMRFSMKHNDPGGRSRSPAFGKWENDDRE